MGARGRIFTWAPAWMWLFWLAGALVIAAGFLRGGEPEPRFLVATGQALEIWRGAERESTLLKFDDRSQILEAALSPDGSQIAFIRLTPPPLDPKADIGTDLYIAARDGSNPLPILRHSAYGEFIETPVWLPGGNQIAYAITTLLSDETVDRRIEVVDVATRVRKRLLADADQPAVMPGGNQLLVRLFDARPGRGRETPVLYDIATEVWSDLPGFGVALVYIGSFAVSPDGKQVAFGAADPSAAVPAMAPMRGTSVRAVRHPILQDIWLMDLDGANLRRVAELAVHQPSIVWAKDGASIYSLSAVGFLRIGVKTGAQEILGPGITNGHLKALSVPKR